MGVTRLFCTPDAAAAEAAHGRGRIGVALHHTGSPDLPGLGAGLADAVRRRLPDAPSQVAWDFLAIALSVFAADRFVPRAGADDVWTRVLHLEIAVRDPAVWNPLAARIASAVRFLTGDIWSIVFVSGGAEAPVVSPKLTDRNAVCLFSGGMDSLLGAMSLQAAGCRPLLVSQGSPKEIGPQKRLAMHLQLDADRFEGRVREVWRPPYEPSTRSRSILFFAYGALAASALRVPEVVVPENALIAVNPPFTRRRAGSLSTRTTHPYFMSEMDKIWAAAGLGVRLRNPFAAVTKGEMLAAVGGAGISEIVSGSYSCGKGKRLNRQCGRCVPCLIRRASFHAANVEDQTNYRWPDLARVGKADDVFATRIAVARHAAMAGGDLERWAAMAGPLPADKDARRDVVDAVGRGVAELGSFLAAIPWPR